MATPDQHAMLSASSAERWLNCPGSIPLCEPLGDGETSEYAEEGRLAHSVGELKLRKHFTPMKKSEFDGAMAELKKDPRYKPEMMACTDEYLSVVQKLVADLTTYEIFLEQRVDYSRYAPGGFGTADCIIVGQLKSGAWVLHVVDYKHGSGVPVSAIENPQLKLYALGALIRINEDDELRQMLDGSEPRDIEVLSSHIVQPRSSDGSSSFTTTRDDLLLWAETVVKPAAQLAYSGDGPVVPGPWCTSHFCLIRYTCRARVKKILTCMFDDRLLADVATLTPDEIAELLAITEDLIPWRKGLGGQAFKIANNSKTGLPGYKIVRGRSERGWKDPEKAAQKLLDAGLTTEEISEPKKIISPAQAEGLLGKDRFKELVGGEVSKPPGKPTLVPESDRRSSLNRAQEDFGEFV